MSAPPTYPGFPPTPPPPTPPTPQYPGQPSYPVAPGQLPGQYQQPYPQQYAPPPLPGYPPMQMAPQQQLAQGSIDDFYNQPSGGNGKALSFPAVGTRYIGIVTRPITSADIQQQTTPPNAGSIPQFYKDGRPKFVMKVPLQMQPSAAFPDGLATWFVKGQARDELVRAMAEAGAPAGPPEHLSVVDVTFVSERPVPGMNASKQFRIVYTRPEGSTNGAIQQPAQQPGVPVPPPAPQAAPPAPAAAAQQAYAQPMDPAQAAAAANVAAQFPQATAVAPPQAPPAEVDPRSGMDAAQQALLARLTGQQG